MDILSDLYANLSEQLSKPLTDSVLFNGKIRIVGAKRLIFFFFIIYLLFINSNIYIYLFNYYCIHIDNNNNNK